jgi:hypothetical protein
MFNHGIMGKVRGNRIALRVDDDTLYQIKRVREAAGQDVSTWIRAQIEEGIDRVNAAEAEKTSPAAAGRYREVKEPTGPIKSPARGHAVSMPRLTRRLQSGLPWMRRLVYQ